MTIDATSKNMAKNTAVIFYCARKFRAAEVINRDRSSEGQSYQLHFRDDGHGIRGSNTGGKDDQRRDRASLMRAMPKADLLPMATRTTGAS